MEGRFIGHPDMKRCILGSKHLLHCNICRHKYTTFGVPFETSRLDKNQEYTPQLAASLSLGLAKQCSTARASQEQSARTCSRAASIKRLAMPSFLWVRRTEREVMWPCKSDVSSSLHIHQEIRHALSKQSTPALQLYLH